MLPTVSDHEPVKKYASIHAVLYLTIEVMRRGSLLQE
jgi:hypothetical protein